MKQLIRVIFILFLSGCSLETKKDEKLQNNPTILSDSIMPFQEKEKEPIGAGSITTINNWDTLTNQENNLKDSLNNVMLSAARDSIWHLEKVQKQIAEIDRLSNGERHLSMITIEREGEYQIKLAEDNGVSYVTYMNFFIDVQEGWKIYFYDPWNNERIEMNEW
jgi:hypothetical protein